MTATLRRRYPRWAVKATGDLDRVIVRRPSPTKGPMRQMRYACRARSETRATLALAFEDSGLLAEVRARNLKDLVAPEIEPLEAYRREERGLVDPVDVRIEATVAQVIYAPRYYTKTWDALFIAFGPESASNEWKDVYMGDRCRTGHLSGYFGVCLGVDGRINLLIVEGPNPLLEPAAAAAIDRIGPRGRPWIT